MPFLPLQLDSSFYFLESLCSTQQYFCTFVNCLPYEVWRNLWDLTMFRVPLFIWMEIKLLIFLFFNLAISVFVLNANDLLVVEYFGSTQLETAHLDKLLL